ncbi:hypothetical protein GCM10009540_29180 [Streptomyces turgidiscabies]
MNARGRCKHSQRLHRGTLGEGLCALEGESAARRFDSRPSAGTIVLYVLSPILSGLIEAELRPQGQEQTDKG